MERPRIALLNAAQNGENTRRNFRRELDADLVEYDVNAGQLPDGFAFDGAVVTGSKASVYWDEPWIRPLLDWLRAAVDRGLPILGVCFGHQALAAALDGTVEDMGEYELGYRTVRRTGESELLGDLDGEFTAFTTHSDRVTEAPPGARVTAENDYGIHGFEVGPALAVQFHPEYDRETAVAVTEGKDLPRERIERALDTVTDENEAAAERTKRLFDAFTRYVRRIDRARAAD